MANYVFNVAKGRIGEFAYRVKNGDPAASRLYVVALSATPGTQETAQDADTFADFVTAGAVEAVNTNYARKILTAADITVGADDTPGNNKYWVDLADQTWTAVAATPAWVALVVCYMPASTWATTAIPLTHHDFAVTPDGSDITAQFAATGIWQAT
jgi:hypothetical protein